MALREWPQGSVSYRAFRACFPPDRIHVILCEELARDPATAYAGLLARSDGRT